IMVHASGRIRRSLRSVEESFSDFDDPSLQPGNSPSGSKLKRDLPLIHHNHKAADGSNSLNQINLTDEPMLSDLKLRVNPHWAQARFDGLVSNVEGIKPFETCLCGGG